MIVQRPLMVLMTSETRSAANPLSDPTIRKKRRISITDALKKTLVLPDRKALSADVSKTVDVPSDRKSKSSERVMKQIAPGDSAAVTTPQFTKSHDSKRLSRRSINLGDGQLSPTASTSSSLTAESSPSIRKAALRDSTKKRPLALLPHHAKSNNSLISHSLQWSVESWRKSIVVRRSLSSRAKRSSTRWSRDSRSQTCRILSRRPHINGLKLTMRSEYCFQSYCSFGPYTTSLKFRSPRLENATMSAARLAFAVTSSAFTTTSS